MRLLVLAERLLKQPWSASGLAGTLALNLAARGHHITLVCEAAEDHDKFARAGITLRPCVPFCYRKTAGAQALRRHFATAASSLSASHDATISLTWLRTAPVWMPLGDAAEAAPLLARQRLDGLRLLCTDAMYADCRGAPRRLARLLAETLARTHTESALRLRTLIVETESCIGSAAEWYTKTNVVEPERTLRTVALGHISTTERPSASAVASLRRATRDLLAIEPGATVGLVPLAGRISRDMLPLLRAAAGVRGSEGPLVLLVMAPDGYAVLNAAARAGLYGPAALVGNIGSAGRPSIRVVMPTMRPDALLAACDFGVLPHPKLAGEPWDGVGSRVIAGDLLAWSRPLLLRGGDVLGLTVSRAPEAGLVVAEGDIAGWHRALTKAADPTWRISAALAARAQFDIARATPDRIADVLEHQAATSRLHAASYQPTSVRG